MPQFQLQSQQNLSIASTKSRPIRLGRTVINYWPRLQTTNLFAEPLNTSSNNSPLSRASERGVGSGRERGVVGVASSGSWQDL